MLLLEQFFSTKKAQLRDIRTNEKESFILVTQLVLRTVANPAYHFFIIEGK